MEAIAWTVALFVGIFRWLFRTLGGKRVASIIALLLLPASIYMLATEPGTKGAVPFMLGASVLAVAAGFALWRTRFFNTPLSACDPITNAAAWVSIAAGYIVIAFFFLVLAFTAFIMAVVIGALSSFLGI